jgi:hypothetical protein
MLHTLSPLAGGSPHNGLQIIHSVSLHFIFCNRFPSHAAGAFTIKFQLIFTLKSEYSFRNITPK